MVKPGLDALGGIPPRFYMGTPVLLFRGRLFSAIRRHPGVVRQEEFRGLDYDVVKITFARATQATPEDYYVAYIDPATGHLKWSITS